MVLLRRVSPSSGARRLSLGEGGQLDSHEPGLRKCHILQRRRGLARLRRPSLHCMSRRLVARCVKRLCS